MSKGNTDDFRKAVSSALHQIRTRALRDAPVYLQHVNSAEQELNQLASGLFTQQQVEQMMSELVGNYDMHKRASPPLYIVSDGQIPVVADWDDQDEDWKKRSIRDDLRTEQRQSIPSIIKKHKEVM